MNKANLFFVALIFCVVARVGATTLDDAFARAEAVQRQLQLLEDQAAIERLQRAYGYFVDKSMWEEVAKLFTADGTLEIGGRGVFVGPERVLQYMHFLSKDGPQPGTLSNHLQLQPIVTVNPDGATAHGRWRFVAQVGVAPVEPGGEATIFGLAADDPRRQQQQSNEGQAGDGVWGTGVYENDYVKENGVWKIKKLYSYFRMYTFYSQGWGRQAQPNTRPETVLPPDRPPTVTYDMYPSVWFVPFHYPNPVTGNAVNFVHPGQTQ